MKYIARGQVIALRYPDVADAKRPERPACFRETGSAGRKERGFRPATGTLSRPESAKTPGCVGLTTASVSIFAISFRTIRKGIFKRRDR